MSNTLTYTLADEQLTAALATLAQRIKGLSGAPLHAAGMVLVERIALCFVDSQSPWGETWKPIGTVAKAMRAQRHGNGGRTWKQLLAAAAGQSAQPLMDTRRLSSSITLQQSGRGVTVGTNVAYAPTHQFGAKVGEYGRYYQLARRKFPDKFRRNSGSVKGHPIPWGNITARPFMPIRHGQIDLPPAWRDELLAELGAEFAHV